MKIIRNPQDLQREPSKLTGFVPTMGALHEGHIALINQSKNECDHTVVSIFVNPKQFGPKEDFTKYPRPENRDLELCEKAGVDVVLLPDASSIYDGDSLTICVQGVTEMWEGVHRPGHFDGVATVVAILFNIVRPNIAYFGQKDYQQCAVIDRLVKGLHYDIQLKFVETIREPDGLALSSRNAYLTPEQRSTAPILYQTLFTTKKAIESTPDSTSKIAEYLIEAKDSLNKHGFDVDYFAFVDPTTLEPISRLTQIGRLIVAAKIGNTRLIDNISVVL